MNEPDLWSRTNTNPDFFPTADQELLLHAALDDEPGAARAWEAWKSRVDIERLDVGSHRLLPLLYRNLQTHGVQDPVLARIKGVYRRTWYENQLLFNRLSNLLCSLNRAGFRTMVLKGVAISLGHYREIGARPMEDFDVLVPFRDGPRCIPFVKDLGCRELEKAVDIETLMATQHSCGFVDAAGTHFDLHWNILFRNLGENADDDFWRQAVPLEVNGEKTLMLCPTDQLLHVCSHGAMWNPIPPIRWVADSLMILKSSAIDWSRLLMVTRKTGQTHAAIDTLRYLRERFGAPVPPGLLEDLRRTRTPFLQRSTYRALAQSNGGLTIGLVLHFREHARSQGDAAWWNKLGTFPGFLRDRWKLQRSWEIPVYIASNAAQRIWQRAFGK